MPEHIVPESPLELLLYQAMQKANVPVGPFRPAESFSEGLGALGSALGNVLPGMGRMPGSSLGKINPADYLTSQPRRRLEAQGLRQYQRPITRDRDLGIPVPPDASEEMALLAKILKALSLQSVQ